MADDDAPNLGEEKTPEQIAAEQEEAARTAEIESRASRMGWTPKEQFRGDPDKWVDAKTFVDRGDNMLPILRERNKKMDERIARQDQEMRKLSTDNDEIKTRLGEVTQAFNQFREFTRATDERAYKRAKTEIEAKMSAAVASADTPAFHAAKAELDNLAPPPPAAPPPQQQERQAPPPARPPATIDPEIPLWVSQNPWYESDPAMKAFAVAVNQQLLADRPGMSMRDNLAEVRTAVMARFPDKFSNTRREAPPAVATTSTPSQVSRPKGKTFSDIPAADRAAYAEFQRWMPDYKKEDFAAQYFAGDE